MSRSTDDISQYRPKWRWLGRSLANFKSLNRKAAEERGILAQLEACRTLTQARKLMQGQKVRL